MPRASSIAVGCRRAAVSRSAIASTSAAPRQHKAYGALCVDGRLRPHQVHPLPEQSASPGRRGDRALRDGVARALRTRHARAGDTVLIHGASGGVGVAATQFARAAGLTVIGTAGTDDGLASSTRRARTTR